MMKFKERALKETILRAAKTFPAIVVTGPRQSGKTTLLKEMFGRSHRYVSLENPPVRMKAVEDPLGFLDANPGPLVLDEIQYAPDLLSYIKTRIDGDRIPGQWILTGSQNFILMEGVSQSLAGRAAVLSLLPFSYAEKIEVAASRFDLPGFMAKRVFPEAPAAAVPIADHILRGSYPEIASSEEVDRKLWCGSYISTYLERDVRTLSQIGDLNQFERFLRMCAIRTGQILNLSDMAREIGISVPTAKRWLSMLETGYQVFLLYPYYRNVGKRIVKSPKLYFTDTALATYLMGIHDHESLLNSPMFGNIFETMIICDFLKRFLHRGETPSIYYLKTRDSLEIDLIIELAMKLYLFEIKSTMTVYPRHARTLRRAWGEFKEFVAAAALISRGETALPLADRIGNLNWETALLL